jgi:hypothetical protein
MDPSLNVLGLPLRPCSHDPVTGWYRDGCCNTDACLPGTLNGSCGASFCTGCGIGQACVNKMCVPISVKIGANGSTCSAGVSSNELANPGVAECTASYYRSGGFPAPKGGCVQVSVPINYVPGQ